MILLLRPLTLHRFQQADKRRNLDTYAVNAEDPSLYTPQQSNWQWLDLGVRLAVSISVQMMPISKVRNHRTTASTVHRVPALFEQFTCIHLLLRPIPFLQPEICSSISAPRRMLYF